MMWTQKRLAACSNEEVRSLLEFENLLRSEAMHELHQMKIRVAEHMTIQLTKDELKSFAVEVGRQMKNLEKTFSDINNNMDLLRERLSQKSEEPNFQEEQDMPLELMSEVPDWSQTTEHQIAHEDQCILMSELPPEEPNVHGEQCMVLELMSEIDRPQDEVSELGEISEDEVIEEFLALLEPNIPNEEYGVEKEEKSVEDENVNINEDCKVFIVVDPHLETDDGLKGCFFHYYLTPFFDFYVDCSNENLLKCGGIFDQAPGVLIFQDVLMSVRLSYHWDSTDGALQFDEKWPPPLPHSW